MRRVILSQEAEKGFRSTIKVRRYVVIDIFEESTRDLQILNKEFMHPDLLLRINGCLHFIDEVRFSKERKLFFF